MLRSARTFVLGLAAASMTCAADPADDPLAEGAVVIAHGVICEVAISDTMAAPETESGVVNVIDGWQGFDVTTTRVPLQRGISFGLRVNVAKDAPALVGRAVVRHPPLGDAGVTMQSWSVALEPGGAAASIYTFELPHELVAGLWTFEIVAKGQVLASQSFDVVPVDQAQDVARVCAAPTPLS